MGQTRVVELADDDALLTGFDKDTRYSVGRDEPEGVDVLRGIRMEIGASRNRSAQSCGHQPVPRLELGYEYNDNYRLDFPGDEIDVSGAWLGAAFPLRLVDPVR